jgi:putative photosynthetic complex assembly protein 2
VIEAFALPAVITVVVWWLSTGIVLWAARRGSVWDTGHSKARQSDVIGTLAVLGVGFGLAWWSDRSNTIVGAIGGFAAAILIWGWVEYAFLTGKVTGTHTQTCPPEARGWRRFKLAAGTVIHHELALVAALGALAAVSFVVGQAATHATAFWTFAMLLVMRLSTKLNLYVGVANFTDGFLPTRMAYLQSYFGRARWTPLMAISIVSVAGLVVWWGEAALSGPSGTASQFSAALLTVLALLGLIEHGFLTVPMGEAALWRWASGDPNAISPARGADSPSIDEDSTNWWAAKKSTITSQTRPVPSVGQTD